MPWISTYVLDNGLVKLHQDGKRLDICTAEPTTYAEATGAQSLGNKTSLTVLAPEERTQVGKQSGRKVVVQAITDGSVTKTGPSQYWAITDPANSRLLATGPLGAKLTVTKDYIFTLEGFDIGIPNCQ